MNNGKRTVFDYVNGIVLTLLALITLYPFLQTLLTSFASYKDVAEADFLVVPWLSHSTRIVIFLRRK